MLLGYFFKRVKESSDFMKVCHVCGACCEDTAELCFVCGAEFLSDDVTVANSDGEIEATINEPVLAASLQDFVSAQILCDMLAENKIPYSFGNSDDVGMQITFNGAFADIDVYVEKRDYEKSQAVYEEFLLTEQNFEEFDEEFEEE